MKEYLKHLLIRTPLEAPAMQIQDFITAKTQQKNPKLHEVYKESKRLQEVILRFIKPSSNCIDIGVHLGSVLSEIIRIAPQGHHLAFEPTPYKAKWLRQKFPEVKVFEIALSDQPGNADFYLNTEKSGFSGLSKHMGENSVVEKLSVSCDCLDNIVKSDRKIDFIKLDVEGHELGVLRGAKNLLQRDRPTILFECTNSGLTSSGYTASEVFEFLTQLQYSIFLPKELLENGQPLTWVEFDRSLQYPFKAFNFIAKV
jgi:FkbM family methyltransferase